MKKHLLFLYRYLTQSRRWRRYITPQTLLVAGVLAAFLATLAWTAPSPSGDHPPTKEAAAVKGSGSGDFHVAKVNVEQVSSTLAPAETGTPMILPTPTRTPLPEEYLSNRDQTDGIAIAASLLVFIVIIGVVMFFPRNKPA